MKKLIYLILLLIPTNVFAEESTTDKCKITLNDKQYAR